MNKRFRFVHFLFILFLSISFLSGCSFRDIDNRAFVLAIAVDDSGDTKKPYKVTIKVVIPSGNIKQEGVKYAFFSEKGVSISEALALIRATIDKDIDFSHTKIIIVSKSLLDRNLGNVTDFFHRRRDIQLVSWIGFAEKRAKDILKMEPKSQSSVTTPLFNFFSRTAVQSPYITPMYLFDFRRQQIETGIDPVLPIIKIDKKEKRCVIHRALVIGDGKYVELTPQQTMIYNILRGNIERFNAEIKEKNGKFKYGVFIDSTSIYYKINRENSKQPIINYKIRHQGILEESSKYTESNLLKEYGKETSKIAKKMILELLTYFQKQNVDPLGFGLRYKATNLHTGDTYKEWESLYPQAKFTLDINVNIISTGKME
jgi:spore germination protein KC